MKEKERKIKKLQAVKLRDDPRIGDLHWSAALLPLAINNLIEGGARKHIT